MNQKSQRPKIAAVVTAYHKYFHAQHIVDRLLDGYGWAGTYHEPPFEVAGLYVDQAGVGDLSAERAARHPEMKIYPTVAEAVTLGTGKLAVEGVVIVGEHGAYPKNEKGQTMYPRFQFFEQVVDVFKASNRTVPVFSDKHLSWNFEWARKMYDQSKAMGFAFMAGSSLPVTWRIPSIEMPLGSKIREAVCTAYGGVDSYDFHALETIQCMVERRKGGETGVRWLQAYRGDNFWKAYEEGVWSHKLMNASLSRSHTLKQSNPKFTNAFPTVDEMRSLIPHPVAYTYEHNDGLRCTMLLLMGMIRDFNFAAQMDDGKIISTEMYLPMPDGRTTLADFFSPLVHHIEEMILTKKSPLPIERTLLTTGLTASGVDSLYKNQTRVETPELAISYQPREESTFERI
jgi:hypothetical protein